MVYSDEITNAKCQMHHIYTLLLKKCHFLANYFIKKSSAFEIRNTRGNTRPLAKLEKL